MNTPTPSSSSSTPNAKLNAGPNTVLVLAIILGAITILPAAMLVPLAAVNFIPSVMSVFPGKDTEPPQTGTQRLAQQLEGQGIAFDADSFDRGKATFAASCAACHTADGGAKPGLGKDMIKSSFTAGLDDKGLVTFLKVGRDAGDPLNTTGVGMPPKGGDPTLTDDKLGDLVSFIRGRQFEEGVSFSR
ncbi:MAG: cytochrome c [Algisphaera sp.]